MSVKESSSAEGKVLLFVHGAGKTNPDYAAEPLAAISKLLGTEPPHVAVYYPDISYSGSPFGAAAVPESMHSSHLEEPPRVKKFKTAYAELIQSNLYATRGADQAVSATDLPGQDIAELIAAEVREIAGYLFNPLVYNKIQSRFYGGLIKASQMGDKIVLAGHSLGSVVSFDGLRAMGSRFVISTFITLGCPLSKLRILGNRPADLEEITYEHVGEWLNFFDTTDPIAGPLGPSFPLPGYRLRDVFVDVAASPLPAHDYFRNPEVLEEIARALK